MKTKMKNRTHRYDINRLGPSHGNKYIKYKMRLIMIMLICIKQHQNNISSSNHDKVKQVLKKSVAYKKRVYRKMLKLHWDKTLCTVSPSGINFLVLALKTLFVWSTFA